MTHKVLKSCRNKMATLPHEHDVCDVQGASSLYIKTWWQSCIYVYIYIYLVFPNGGMVGIPLPDKNLLILPLPTEFLFPPTKSQFNPIKKNVVFICSHCSCTIFVLLSYSFETQIMLILVLIDVQYSQNAVFSFEKFANHHNHSSSDYHHLVKKNPSSFH